MKMTSLYNLQVSPGILFYKLKLDIHTSLLHLKRYTFILWTTCLRTLAPVYLYESLY